MFCSHNTASQAPFPVPAEILNGVQIKFKNLSQSAFDKFNSTSNLSMTYDAIISYFGVYS